MRIVKKLADTAGDSVADGDGDDSLPLTAGYGDVGTGSPQGTDDVGLCPHWLHGESGSPAVPPFLPDRRRRSPLGTSMGLRETARYGLRVVRVGEASHPGPTDLDPGDRVCVLRAAAVAARVARVDMLWSLCVRATGLCVQSARPSRSRGLASLGPTPLVTRRGLPRRTRRRRTLGPGLLPLLTPARPTISLLPMGGDESPDQSHDHFQLLR